MVSLSFRNGVLVGLCFLVALTSGGCLFSARSNVSYSGKGKMVSPSTLKQIVPYETKRAELVAILGEPTRTTPVEGTESDEVLVYEYVKRTKSGAAVFLLLAVGDTKEERRRLYFMIENGVMTKTWRD